MTEFEFEFSGWRDVMEPKTVRTHGKRRVEADDLADATVLVDAELQDSGIHNFSLRHISTEETDAELRPVLPGPHIKAMPRADEHPAARSAQEAEQ